MHRSLDELESDKLHELFEKFVEKWNSGALPELIYNLGNSLDATDQRFAPPRMTKHKWLFTNVDKKALDSIIQEVKDDTSRTDHLTFQMS